MGTLNHEPLSPIPDWAAKYGDGDGNGYGYGYGNGYGDGSGDGDGSGYGNGYGDGSGYGNGYGDGSGDGNGYGDGNGDGNGYGYGNDGNGYGYGYGNGYGDGSGDGNGYGNGNGNGYGYGGSYWLACVAGFANKWPQTQHARLEKLKADGARIAYWRSTDRGTSANGGNCAPVAPGTIHEEPGPLRAECGSGQLHATLIPPKWKGERWWIVALLGEVRGDDEKMWSLKREILGECL